MQIFELPDGYKEIKKYSGKKAAYGFNGLYAYAKSEAYFNKQC